uniref:Uncharacterized protein n=1 Tax=Cannabis sativa TaxID=3483 RepID=A0A803PVE9_CANSA
MAISRTLKRHVSLPPSGTQNGFLVHPPRWCGGSWVWNPLFFSHHLPAQSINCEINASDGYYLLKIPSAVTIHSIKCKLLFPQHLKPFLSTPYLSITLIYSHHQINNLPEDTFSLIEEAARRRNGDDEAWGNAMTCKTTQEANARDQPRVFLKADLDITDFPHEGQPNNPFLAHSVGFTSLLNSQMASLSNMSASGRSSSVMIPTPMNPNLYVSQPVVTDSTIVSDTPASVTPDMIHAAHSLAAAMPSLGLGHAEGASQAAVEEALQPDLQVKGKGLAHYTGLKAIFLDWVVVSESWSDIYPNHSLQHLSYYGSDHRVLKLSLAPSNINYNANRTRRFRFENTWLEDPSFYDVVKNAWTSTCVSNSVQDQHNHLIGGYRSFLKKQGACISSLKKLE